MCFLFSRILCVLIARHKSSGNNNFSFLNHFLADGAAWSAIRKVGLSVRHKYKRILISIFDNIMSDPIRENVQKMYDSRVKDEADLNRYQNDVREEVNNTDRCVRVEQLVTSCEETC